MYILTHVMFPVIGVFALGYVLQKFGKLQIASISKMTTYIFVPMLVLKGISTAELGEELRQMGLFSIILLLMLFFIGKVYSFLFKLSSNEESSNLLTTVFLNAGNYGAPIVLFAYGEEGFKYALMLLVIHQIINYTLGVYIAASGKHGFLDTLRSISKIPVIYAVIMGILLNRKIVILPTPLESIMELLAGAAIPLIMILLGMQLAQIELKSIKWKANMYGVITRNFLSPLIAWGIVSFLGIEGLVAKILILIAAMPSAASIAIYAVQFDNNSETVSSITLMTTLLSIVTIPILLYILG